MLQYQKVSKYDHDRLQNFFCCLCFYQELQLLKAVMFSWNLLYLSKEHPRPNLKVFGYRIWTSVKRWVKQLSTKAKFITFLQLSSSNFRLKVCEKTDSYQYCPKN